MTGLGRSLLGCILIGCGALLPVDAAEPSVRKIIDSTITGTVSFEPPRQSFTDYTTGNLLIRDLRTGEVRVLVRAEAGEGADWSTITRDGRIVAYTWYASDGTTELRVAETAGAPPRIVLGDPELEYVEPHDWTPDGTQILTHLVFRGWRTEIALVNAADGLVRRLKSFEFRPWGRRMCVSPDGQLIAYDTPQEATTADRDVFVLRTDGTGEVRWVEHPANDIVLGWFPDGDLLFASNRSGRWNAYRTSVSRTAPQKELTLVMAGLTPDFSELGFERDQTYVRGLGFTSDGSFYYGFSDWKNEAYVMDLDPEGKVANPPHQIADLLAFKSSVAWSPDGKRLALFTWHGWEPYSLLLRVRSVATGQEQRLPLAMTRMLGNAIHPTWSPDGRYLMAAGSDGGSKRGIFRIDVDTGETTPIAVSTNCPPECVEWPVWLSNRQVAFVRRGWDGASQLVHSIVSHDLSTGSAHTLYQAGSSDRLSHLVISPDRKSLAFLRRDEKHETHAITIVSLAGGSLREIYQVKAPASVFDLAWAADGKHIVFATGIGGAFGTEMSGGMNFVAWRVSTRGGKPESLGLSMDGVELYGISVRPHGRGIAFAAGTPLRGELWRLDRLLELAPGEEILRLEQERVEAYRRGDIAALERLLSADLTLTSGYGEFRRREEAIRYLRDEYLPSDQQNDGITVRIYGPAAVVTGRTITSFVVNGRRATNHARFLRVWVKQPDGWRNVVFQGTFMLRRFSEDPQPARVVSSHSTGVPSTASGRSHDAKAEVLRFENQRLRALRENDASMLDRLLAPEYVFVDTLGAERTRAEIVAGIARASGARRSQLEDDGVEVRVYGNAAVVTGRTITRVRDSERTTSTRFTRVWVKHESDWRLVVYQATHEMARTPLAPDFPDHARADRPQSERIQRLLEVVRHRGAEALEEFWREVSDRGTPLIEPIPGDDKHLLVSFLWRGGDETRNVVIFSGVTMMWSFTRGDLIDHSMERIAGTDVWFRSYTLPRDARFSYYLSPNDSLLPSAELTKPKDYESRAATWQHDPLNPRREVRPHADKDWGVSLVELPDAPPKPWLNYKAQETGSLVEHTITSQVLGGERRVWIYLPPRYEGSSDPYRLLVNFDGSEFGTSKSAAVLDYLIGEGKITPVVAVWIEQQNRRAELECSEDWNRFVVSEVVSWVRANYRVTSDPQRTVVGGGSLGGLAALCLGLKHPETFGNVLSLSAFVVAPSHGFIMREFAASPKLPLRFYLDVGLFERDEDNLLFGNRHLRDVLLAKGYQVHYAEFAGGHDSTHTDIGFVQGLKALLPKHAASSARAIDLQPVRLLTSDGRYEDAEPAPSPDGKHVSFARVDVERKGRWRLWIVATSGGLPRPLTPPDFDWDCTRPSWSRDGQWIAFRASRAVNGSELGGIWIMPASGGAPRQLTGRSPAEDDYYPQWFPDGQQLAVLRDVPGTESDVWVVTLNGTASRLTTHPAFDGKSTISPDGRWIAFPSERGGARDLWIMPVAEGESAARQFTFDGGRGPAWSPDGRWIAYGCPVRPRGYALCLKRIEGGPVIQVTDGSRNDFNPEWGPDGTWIAVAQGDDDAFGRTAIVDVGDIVASSKAGSGRITQNMVPTPEEGPQLVLNFATYLGGSGRDDCDAVAVDRSGSIYLACHSNSKEFPLATSTPEMDRERRRKSSTSWEQLYDAFVVKLDPTGSRVLYTTSLGGSRWEGAAAITVDVSGNVYVAGKTESPDLPTTKGALQTSFGGDYDVFVAKLDASGAVVYCTYLGGSGEDSESDIVADEAGNVYVVGTTWSKDFPTTQGVSQRTLRGKQDAFVAKLDATGSVLLYSTYLGGQQDEEGWSIALEGEGNTYVTGKTRSKDFFVTPDALQQSLAGGADVFISKLDARGSNLLYSTYLGGSGDEDIWDDNGNFALDAQGLLHVAGTTESHNFPTTPNAFQRNFAGGKADAFLTKLDLSNPRLVYSTYLGGSSRDGATGVGVDAQGRAVVTGETNSPNFPMRKAVQSAFAGGESDAFVLGLSQDGSALLYSTYLGGSGRETPEDIAVDRASNVYVSGSVKSPDFPTMTALQPAHGGGRLDIFLARFEQRSGDRRQWKIAFESERDGHREIYVMIPDGSNQQRLTHTPGTGEGSWSPRWSPDRTRVAFTSTREGDLNEIYVMEADGSNVQRLTHTTGKESANPAWSPDGKRIVFESNRDGNYEIYAMDADGSNVHRLTHTKGRGKHSENPDWSPDGKRIAFESNRDGNYEIYAMDADGSNVHRLTHRPGRSVGTWRPRWSPDGTRIAFSSGRERNEQIYTMNPDGSDLRRLTHTPGENLGSRHPAWSPDGKKIIFQSTRDGKSENWYHNFEMYVMDTDGSNVQRLTFNQKWDGHPDW